MTRKTNTVKGKAYHYYYCRTTKKGGCGHSVTLKEETLVECIRETIRTQIAHMVSVEKLLAGSQRQQILDGLANKTRTQIADNQSKLIKIRGFKASLYENLVAGHLSKEEYKTFKASYTASEEATIRAIEQLEKELGTVLLGKSDRLQFMEQFRNYQELTTLDRPTVLRFIQSIKVLGKTELQINYHFREEYEQLLAVLQATTIWKEGVA